jgi:hypothetical protein
MNVQNEIKEPEEQPVVKKSRLKRLQEFDFNINRENATRIIPFLLFITAWIIVYIGNHQYGEKTLGKMDRIRKELKELKADFYTTNAELSNQSIQSQVTKKAEPLGLKELTTPPQRVKLLKNER